MTGQEEMAFSLHQGQLRLDFRKHLFTERVIKNWNRLLREVLESPSLDVFKKCVVVTPGGIV